MSKVDLKVVLLGKENGGKTSLVERFIYDRFRGEHQYQNTIGAAFAARKIEVNGELITLGVWDTAGSERYESMSRIYYRDAGAAVVCYDLSDSESFQRAEFWVSEIKLHEENCRIYLCGTKKDLVQFDRKLRKVDYHNTTDLADEVSAVVFETSSKTSDGVFELFNKIAEDYVQHRKETQLSGSLEKLTLVVPSPKKQSCC